MSALNKDAINAVHRAVKLGLESQGFGYLGLRCADGRFPEWEEDVTYPTYSAPGGAWVQVRWVDGTLHVTAVQDAPADACATCDDYAAGRADDCPEHGTGTCDQCDDTGVYLGQVCRAC